MLRGNADANIRFGDLCALLRHLNFHERIRGDHHIFTRDDVVEILNLQPKNGKAKPYQVKQVRNVITAYELADETQVNDEASPEADDSQNTEDKDSE